MSLEFKNLLTGDEQQFVTKYEKMSDHQILILILLELRQVRIAVKLVEIEVEKFRMQPT